jgi:hypothetical protein
LATPGLTRLLRLVSAVQRLVDLVAASAHSFNAR